MSQVRDAMVPEPGAHEASATAQEAGERLSDPAVRAVQLARETAGVTQVVDKLSVVR